MTSRAVESWRLPFDRSSAREARRRLRLYIADAGLSTVEQEDAVVVFGELIANALDHGSALPDGSVSVEIECFEDLLRMTVSDGGGTTHPQVQPPDPYAERGRGLAMVDAISERWIVDESNGTRVTAWLLVAASDDRLQA